MATSNLDKFVRGRLPDLPESRERYYQDEFRKLERQAATAYDKFTLTDKNVEGLSAELELERTVRASADTAIASQVTTLTTTVGNNTTSVNQLISSVDGIEGRYGVTINNNGHISGISLLSDTSNGNPTSVFRIAADQFAIRNPGSSTDSIYWNGGASKLVVRGDIEASSVTINAVNTTGIQTNAVTQTYASTGVINTDVGTSSTTVLSMSVTVSTNQSVMVDVSAFIGGVYGGVFNTTANTAVATLSLAGVVKTVIPALTIQPGYLSCGAGTVLFTGISPGTYTLSLNFFAQDTSASAPGFVVRAPTMALLEAKR